MAKVIIEIPDILLDRVLLAYGSDGVPITLVALEGYFTKMIKSQLMLVEAEPLKDAKRIEIDEEDWTKKL